MNIEPLEPRIAPAAVFTYTDVDGDLVTIKTTKGTSADLSATGILIFSDANPANPRQLQEIDFGANAAVFAGTGLTITAKRGATGGDGFANVGYLDATGTDDGTALDLGTISIRGDLGRVSAGDATTTTAAIKALSVQSMGQLGVSTQAGGGNLTSAIAGPLAALTVKSHIREAFINVTGGTDGRIGKVFIGGSIIASPPRGEPPLRAGSIHAVEDIGSITVKGSIIGSESVPVYITAAGRGIAGATTDLALKSLTVGGSVQFASLLFGYDEDFQGQNGDAQVGPVKVGGDWTASNLVAGVNPGDGVVGNGDDFRLTDSDDPLLISKIASIIIGGQVRGQAGTNNTFGFAAEHVVAMKVGGGAVPLLAGARNDTFSAVFADNQARPLGSSLSSLTVDGYAMHVFEV